MRLQGRKLEFNLQGPDVGPLQKELIVIGLDIPDNEAVEQVYGERTQHAVRRFQEARQL